MEFPKIKEILQPKEWKEDNKIAELVVYEKIIESYAKVLLIASALLTLAVML